MMSPLQPLAAEVIESLEALSEVDSDWPVTGGRLVTKEGEPTELAPVLVATGHADGSVAVWRVDALNAAVRRLAVFDSARIYAAGSASDAEKASDWPPMRAVGEQRHGPAPAPAPTPAEGEEEAEPAKPEAPLAVRHLLFAKDGSVVIGGDHGQVSCPAPAGL